MADLQQCFLFWKCGSSFPADALLVIGYWSAVLPGVSAASADAVYNVMTGDQTNWPMIIGISVAAGVAAIAIIVAIILTIVSKAKKNKGYKPKH